MSELAPGATIAVVLTRSTAALRSTSETARLDAEVLLGYVLGIDRARLVVDREVELEGEAVERFTELVSRRAQGEPVAYLIGRRSFRALELIVDRRVLIPRPETETLVEAVAELLPPSATVLDVGTGSGAIALALAAERPDLHVRGIDASGAAVALAERNAAALGLNVSFSVGDLLEEAPVVDALVANLPYVESDAELPVDVAGFEPSLALFGGEDGLDVIRRLVSQLDARPWPAWVLLEIGESQGAAVSGLLRAAGFGRIEVRPDLSGRDRVVVAHRPRGQR